VTRVPPFLGEFSNEDAAWFINVGVRRRVPAGEAIILEGELVTELFVILRGSFSVKSLQIEGMPEIHLGPGEIVGEMTFVRRTEPPLSSVRADVDSVVLCIPRTALDEKLAADPEFGARFHNVVSKFTVARLYGSWRPEVPKLPAPPAPPEPIDPLKRVYDLIRVMLPPKDGETGKEKRKRKAGDEGKGKDGGKKDGGEEKIDEGDDDERKPPPG
jgi:CRP/FNR family cyclic AMP-dependent transcriptional regulator